MKKLSILFGLAMLVFGIFASGASNTSAAPLTTARGANPVPCAMCPQVGKFSITVLDGSSSVAGRPVAGADVEVFGTGSSLAPVASGTTDANGMFSTTLEAGMYRVQISADGYNAATQNSKVIAGQTTNTTTRLTSTNAPLPCVPCGPAR